MHYYFHICMQVSPQDVFWQWCACFLSRLLCMTKLMLSWDTISVRFVGHFIRLYPCGHTSCLISWSAFSCCCIDNIHLCSYIYFFNVDPVLCLIIVCFDIFGSIIWYACCHVVYVHLIICRIFILITLITAWLLF